VQPWSASWVATRPGAYGNLEEAPVDPAIALFYWCAGLFVFTLICGFLALIGGEVLDRIYRRRA
jgi:hypothetical protein